MRFERGATKHVEIIGRTGLLAPYHDIAVRWPFYGEDRERRYTYPVRKHRSQSSLGLRGQILRIVGSQPEDRLTVLSDVAWSYIQARGAFYEATDGETILEYGETDDHLLIILSGKATLVYIQNGRPSPTAIFRKAGEVLHHAGMHLQMVNPFQIVAVGDSTRVVMIDRASVYELIGQDVQFAEFLFKDLSERFMVSLSYLREQRQEPLIIRLAKRIRTIIRHQESIEFTQSELADIMAVTRISISKAIKTLEEEGLLKREERSLISVDREKLDAWLRAQEEDDKE